MDFGTEVVLLGGRLRQRPLKANEVNQIVDTAVYNPQCVAKPIEIGPTTSGKVVNDRDSVTTLHERVC